MIKLPNLAHNLFPFEKLVTLILAQYFFVAYCVPQTIVYQNSRKFALIRGKKVLISPMFSNFMKLEEEAYSEEDAAWDVFVAEHPHGSILQTMDWARLKNRFGWTSQRVWLKQDGRFVAGAQILFRSVGLGMIKVGYIPHGPLVDWQNEEQVGLLLNQIDHACYQRGAGIVKIEPLIWQDETAVVEGWTAVSSQPNMAYADTIQPPRTVMVDLHPSEEEILAAMKSKTRYNIRLSARKGVTVRQGTVKDIRFFTQLAQITAQRDGFGLHSPEYYLTAFQFFEPDRAVLLIAEYEKRPLAAAMIFRLGETAAYLYGASGNEERQRMPAYAVQWAAIQWGKQRGCTQYDMWGIPDAEPEELEADFTKRTDGLWPVYRAKRGYGGRVVRTVGAVDRVYNPRTKKLYDWWRRRKN